MYNKQLQKLKSENEGEIKIISFKYISVKLYCISRMETARARKKLCICADCVLHI